MGTYEEVIRGLMEQPRSWLVTGAAGFIGSNLVEQLLQIGQSVVGLDDFSTGKQANLDDVRNRVGPVAWERFSFQRGDVRDPEICRMVCEGVDYVLHQAALGSVPRSIADPVATNQANVDGFLRILIAARDAQVSRFVYAGSSSTYGDDPGLPKVEERIGRPLSPYAVSKYVDELYASVFEDTYGIPTAGLRYFNVFGRRQDPEGAYAAVIPHWIAQLIAGEECVIYGDGETTRDFCYVENVVQANILAATAEGRGVTGEVYNIACGDRTSLTQLFELLRGKLAAWRPEIAAAQAQYVDFRQGDVRHSLADISRARSRLGYQPMYSLEEGIDESLDWYIASLGSTRENPTPPIAIPAVF